MIKTSLRINYELWNVLFTFCVLECNFYLFSWEQCNLHEIMGKFLTTEISISQREPSVLPVLASALCWWAAHIMKRLHTGYWLVVWPSWDQLPKWVIITHFGDWSHLFTPIHLFVVKGLYDNELIKQESLFVCFKSFPEEKMHHVRHYGKFSGL